jgi:polyisoprenoid-binding protein YceI
MRSIGTLALSAVFLFTACKSVPKADSLLVAEAQQVAAVTDGTLYKADLAQTRIEWIGTSPIARHHGTFSIREGHLRVNKGGITAGRFLIDMHTLRADDQDSAGNAQLGNHLKSIDFFDVDQFPEARFEITGVQPGSKGSEGIRSVTGDATHTVTGNLILKDIVKNISFPAHIELRNDLLIADANFNMDRGLWGISYGNDRSLKNKAIRPLVNVQLHLVAAKGD